MEIIQKWLTKLFFSNYVGAWVRGLLFGISGYLSSELKVPANLTEEWAKLSFDIVIAAAPSVAGIVSSYANKKLNSK